MKVTTFNSVLDFSIQTNTTGKQLFDQARWFVAHSGIFPARELLFVLCIKIASSALNPGAHGARKLLATTALGRRAVLLLKHRRDFSDVIRRPNPDEPKTVV